MDPSSRESPFIYNNFVFNFAIDWPEKRIFRPRALCPASSPKQPVKIRHRSAIKDGKRAVQTSLSFDCPGNDVRAVPGANEHDPSLSALFGSLLMLDAISLRDGQMRLDKREKKKRKSFPDFGALYFRITGLFKAFAVDNH